MNFDRRQNRRLSETLTRITGIKPQPNNPINGENAFAHESGIHQDGWLKEREIYEVVHPEDNGYDVINALVLGKHSGHAGVKAKTGAMGIVLSGEQICSLTKEIETWADANPRKRGIPTDELQIMIARNPELQGVGPYRLVNYSDDKHNGTHCVAVSITVNGIPVKSENTATGPIEAGIQAIKSASGIEGFHFEKYLVHSQGKDEGANALVSMEIYREDMPEEHVTA
jgi:isopropylmalate/homocitrate/citramalate synthase